MEARFSLVAGEGDGTILGLAAGDAAGGAWELGYSAITEQVTIISYQLIESAGIDLDDLVSRIAELDGSADEEPVYRSETPHFRAWLDRLAARSQVPEKEPSIDAGPRAAPLGVAFRRDPEALVREVLRLGTVFHSDARSILGGVVAASAVAASCFGQSGRDLVAGVAESVGRGMKQLNDLPEKVEGPVRGDPASDIASLVGKVGIAAGDEALEAAGGDGSSPWDTLLAGLLLAAPVADRPHLPVEQAARIGGSPLGAMVGAIVGARVGIRAWPWPFANDTWFAEIGRRLVRGPDEVRDLPIPYAVEQHLISGEPRGFHR